jgi:predicted ATPase/tRNA A-37 threonylcarbamoyl transferase component Bud32
MRQKVLDKRYTILKKLGTGATGNVYKVRDVRNNNIVALKILSGKKISSNMVRRFGREFKLLAGLHHPNLCSVYDFGVLPDGRSYFTMEYISGRNIFEFTKDIPYEKIYPLIVQLCRVLEYIHSKGLIHYDIKPGNILIAEDGKQRAESGEAYVPDAMPCVKLMDFGLAGEQQIKGGTLIKGTFPYIAPEVIKVLAVDHRADLYSVGVVLYEIFTRRSFHEGTESFVAFLKQREIRASESPSQIVADIPEALEHLILRLIGLEPATRYNHANEIIKEINKMSKSKFAFETEKTLEGYLLSSRFVGRDKEMGLLQSLYERAQRGVGKVILITGDAGIGKTRLLKEFKIFTQLKRSHCFTGHAYGDKTQVLGPFYDIFSELINFVEDGSSLSYELRLSLAVLYKMFPDLTNGHLRKRLPKIVPLEPNQEKLRTFEALSEFIRYCTSKIGGLVILLEDLHWADDLSIQFLEYLGRNLEGKNVLICGTSRRQALRENLILKKMINHLTKEGYLAQIDLKPLKYRSLYSFLDSTITPGSNSSELTRYLMEKTSGNPYFVEEIMRTMLHKSGVSIGEQMDIGQFQEITLPETIEDVVLQRIKNLDRVSQEVIKFGAILLKDFSYDLMKHLTKLGDTELSGALWELKQKQVLIEDGNRYRFYHATLAEAINKRLRNKEKRALNYRIGKTLEKINRGRLNKIVEDLAYYFINARDSKKGVRYGLWAGQKSSERYAYDQAVQFYKGVFDLLPNKDLKRRFAILQKLAEIEVFGNYYDDAIKHYNKALCLKIGTIDERIRIHLKISNIYAIKGEFNKILYICKSIHRLLKKMRQGKLKILLEIYTKVYRYKAYLSIGDYKSAHKFNFDNLNFLENLRGKKALEMRAHIYLNLDVIKELKGEYDKDKTIFYLKKAYKYYKKIKYAEGIGTVLTNLGVTYCDEFNFQRALGYHEKVIQIAEKTGNQRSLSVGLFNLSDILEHTGYYLKALDSCQRGLAISKKIDNPSFIGHSLWIIGICFLRLSDYKKAQDHFEKSLKIFNDLDWKDRRAYLIRDIGNIYQVTGNYTSALRFYRKALKISKDIEHQSQIASSFLEIGSVLIEIGEFSRAKTYLEHALKTAIEIGAKDTQIQCNIYLCHISIIMKDYIAAFDYYQKGMKTAKKIGMRREVLHFSLLASEIYYCKKRYRKGLEIANKSIKIAKDMGTKDLYIEALLVKVKHEIRYGDISKIEVIEILDEAKIIGEEIGYPEILWKVYFEYGVVLQAYKEYSRALEYYEKCIEIFKNMSNKIKNKLYRQNYLDRPDRKIVFAALDNIEKLL